MDIRVAPPDKAAEILRIKGYPVTGKFLRRLYREGQLPGTWTGKRLLIPIEKAISLLENGSSASVEMNTAIRKIPESSRL